MKKYKLTFVLFLSGLLFSLTAFSTSPDSVCYVHYINVGQGDATLLEFPCGAVLIDAGAQSNEYVDSLIIYLQDFFTKRQDLNNTLESVFVTHTHPDHIKGLKEVIETFDVKRVIHNGTTTGNSGDLNWAISNANTLNLLVKSITYDSIIKNGNRAGYSDNDIDPINCGDLDPKITVLSGGFEVNPGWPHGEFDNENNHSLVIRIEFGDAAFLFTGDMEEEGLHTVTNYYDDGSSPNILDCDVYHVGHHGSYNATSTELLDAVTPDIAIIPVGRWDYGKDGSYRFTTWWYGHPRKSTINLLNDYIPRNKKRSQAIKVMVADGSRDFHSKKIKRKIYATAWDGNIKIRATAYGKFIVYTNK